MLVEISDSAGENQDGQVMEKRQTVSPKLFRMMSQSFLAVLVLCLYFDMLNDDIADLLSLEGRAMVYSHLEEDHPLVSILSPPCKMCSLLMKSNKSRVDPEVHAARRVDGEHLLSFAVNVAQHGRSRHRYFLL